jgi:phage terminase Nu1 subunit (DNA packaging protein)
MAVPEKVTRKEIATILGVDERSITNYAQEGMPRSVKGKNVWYPLRSCIAWYIEREKKAAREGKGLSELDAARARKAIADAHVAELKAAEEEGRLIPVETHTRRLEAICDRLRSVLMVVPSKYIGRVLSARTDLDAQTVGEEIRDETLRGLQAIGDELEDEHDEHTDEPPSGTEAA